MKKYIVIALAALVAFAACTKTNPEEKKSEKISFQVANYVPQTKANVSILPETTTFKSYAYLDAQGSGNTLQNFFPATGETITWNATNKEWAPSIEYYWPKSSKSNISFFSWYDKAGAAPAVTTGNTTTAWTMKWTNREVGATDNIMYADPAWHFNLNKEVYKLDGVKEGVTTLFHHALAKVCVKAYVAAPESSSATWKVEIGNLDLKKFYTKGNLSLTAAAEPASTTFNTVGSWATAAWEKTTDAAANGSYTADSAVEITATTAAGANLLLPAASTTSTLTDLTVMPQTTTGIELAFDVKITTTYTSGASNVETLPIIVALPTFGPEAWAMNYKYTYIIKVVPSASKILFDPAVVDFIDGTTTEYVVNY